jgi:hypothetical protein
LRLAGSAEYFRLVPLVEEARGKESMPAVEATG